MFVRLELEFERPFRSSSSSCYALFSNVNSRSSRAAKTFIADVIPQKTIHINLFNNRHTRRRGRGAHRQLTGCWTDGRMVKRIFFFLPVSVLKIEFLIFEICENLYNQCFHSDLKKQNLLVH